MLPVSCLPTNKVVGKEAVRSPHYSALAVSDIVVSILLHFEYKVSTQGQQPVPECGLMMFSSE